jgi:hypothetical protein
MNDIIEAVDITRHVTESGMMKNGQNKKQKRKKKKH